MKKTLAVVSVLAAISSAQAMDFESKGSISVKDLKESGYPKAAKISLEDAVKAALEKQKGKAVSAELDDENGYLVYEVTISTADGSKMEVYVDAGNKKILGIEKDSGLLG